MPTRRTPPPGGWAVAILVAQDWRWCRCLLITNGLGAATGETMFGIAWRLALALGLLVGFIALLTKIKKLPLSRRRLSAQ